jgi:hypothetical protein
MDWQRSHAFPLDRFFWARSDRGRGALKVPVQQPTLGGGRALERRRVKNHSPSQECAPQTYHGGADTGV